jgi:anti-anti-sigma factor
MSFSNGDGFAGDHADLSRAQAPCLTVQDVVCEGRHVLVLAGELDLASRPLLDEMLLRLIGGEVEAVVLDLSRVTFMDSTGLHAILTARALCSQHGCEFLLVQGSPQVQRLFELSGLLDELPFRAAAQA